MIRVFRALFPSLFAATVFLMAGFGSAQVALPALRTYRVTCDPAQFSYILRNYWEDRYIACLFEADSISSRSAQIRIRGESSRQYPKKSFKINFLQADRFDGRDKVNLISCWTDPSYVREFLSYDFFRRAGLPAPRAWFARLYVNGQYHGLYLDVEQVDEHFLEVRGLDRDAPIYKAADNQTTLLPGEIEAGLWERENGDPTRFDELTRLIEWLTYVPDAGFFAGLNDRFDVGKLSRAIAANALLANSSTYYHNYFLIRFRGEAGRWEYVPWDVDRTFYYWTAYSEPPYCRSGHQTVGTNELIRRCWLDPEMRAMIQRNIAGLADSLFTYSFFAAITDSLEMLLREAVLDDTAKQFTNNDFFLSLTRIPQDVNGRGARLRELSVSLPLPFDIRPATITPRGVAFNWSSAASNESDSIRYDLELSRSIVFSAVEWGAQDLAATSYILRGLPVGRIYWRVVAKYGEDRRLISLHQFSPLDIGEFDGNAIELPRTISGVTRLRPGQGIHWAAGDVVVAAGAVLEIERGVRILFESSARLIVEGEVRTVETPGDSVRLQPVDPISGWGGLLLREGSKGDLSYLHLKIGADIAASPDSGNAIELEAGAELKIRRSTFEAAGRYSLYRRESGGGSVIIDSCLFTGSDAALFLEGGDYCSITNNTFIGIGGAAEFAPGWFDPALIHISEQTISSRLENCRFSHARAGLIANGTTRVNLNRCLFEDIQGSAIEVRRAYLGATITNSIFLRCGRGVLAEGSECRIWNCNFVKCGEVVRPIESTEMKIGNSVFWLTDHIVKGAPVPLANLTITSSLTNIPYPGAGNILASPQFEKPWDGDWTPEPGSPLIDAGSSDGAPVTDYFGRPRVNTPGQKNHGTGRYRYYDIGAVEYPSGERTLPAMDGNLISVYPNPSNGRAEIIFEIEVSGRAEIALFDLNGREVFKQNYDFIEAGQHRLTQDSESRLDNLSAGLYFCRFEQLSGISFVRLVNVR